MTFQGVSYSAARTAQASRSVAGHCRGERATSQDSKSEGEGGVRGTQAVGGDEDDAEGNCGMVGQTDEL